MEFSFSFEGDLMEVFKNVHVKFHSERVGNVYMSRNSKVIVILSFKSRGYGTIKDYDGFEFRCSVLPRKQIGTRRATIKCNAQIPRVQRCYCDVYTQDGNTLTYIC